MLLTGAFVMVLLFFSRSCSLRTVPSPASSQFSCSSLSLIVPFYVDWSFFGQIVDKEGLFLSQGESTGVGGEEETPETEGSRVTCLRSQRDSAFLVAPGPEEQEPFFSPLKTIFPKADYLVFFSFFHRA